MIPIKDNNPTDRTAYVTIGLIVANVLMYFLFQKGGLSGPSESNVVKYGAIPFELTHPGDHCELVGSASQAAIACEGQPGVAGTASGQPATWITVFTSMFMHGGLLHLGGNMLFLWIFGNNVEDSMGRVKFVLFYVLGGLAALGLQVAVEPNAAIPTVGASGAIAAVLGGYILLFPRARVVTVVFIILFFTIIELPAIFMLGVWFLQQLLFGLYDQSNPTGGGGGVAYFAHIGGFAFGLLAVKLFATRRGRGGPALPRLPGL